MSKQIKSLEEVDVLAQMRLGADEDWQTHSVFDPLATRSIDAWRRQVGPVLRRRGYETRTVQLIWSSDAASA